MVWDKGPRGTIGTPTKGVIIHCKNFGCWHEWRVSAAELAAKYPPETLLDHMEFRCEKCGRDYNMWSWDWAGQVKGQKQ